MKLRNIMHFSSKEICNIIKACNKAKIQELKLGDFQLTFRSKNEQNPHPGPDANKRVNAEVSTSVLEEELSQRDIEVSDLALENPMRLEDMLANDELEPEDANGDFDRGQT